MTTRAVAAAAMMAVMALAPAACVSAKRPVAASKPVPAGASIWRAPADIAAQDLFYGPWGKELAPDPSAVYTLVKYKRTGVNIGMTVRDPKGREWSVKQPYPGNLDSEGPVEVTLSRLLSAIGYHQPPVYFLPRFTLKDDWGTHTEVGGRFRVEPEGFKEGSSWDWADNPFVGSRPHEGLLALLMLFGSTDIKASNNSIYEYRRGDRVEQWYAARDIGAALGDTHPLTPRKNDADSFEQLPFITGVRNGHVQFAYNGWYKNYVRDRISPENVRWASDQLARLSDRQWQDAFRAGGYDPETAARFIRILKRRVAEGQAAGRAATD